MKVTDNLFFLAKESSGGSELIQVLTNNLSNLTCQADFFESNFTCLPRCADWKQDSPVVSSAIQIIVVVSYVTMLCASVTLVAMFALRHKTMSVNGSVYGYRHTVNVCIYCVFTD